MMEGVVSASTPRAVVLGFLLAAVAGPLGSGVRPAGAADVIPRELVGEWATSKTEFQEGALT
jgi:hypothetical protein